MKKLHINLTQLLMAFVLVAGLGLAAAPTAQAQDLNQLRAQGLVGERYDGLALALDPGTKSVVDQVNQKRLKIYKSQAQQQNISVEAVGSVFAEKIMAKAPKGTKFQQSNGAWVTK